MILKKYVKRIAYLFFLLFTVVGILELSFRYQLFDFYFFEFKLLNTEQAQNTSNKKVLVFGDSFSTYPEGYVSQLQQKNPSLSFINSAIPGTGIRQHQVMFNGRLTKHKANQIIYQFYVGNDFIDINHPVNYKELPFLRNLFWQTSERLLVLQYLNFKLARFNTATYNAEEAIQSNMFAVDRYNSRTKINLKGKPNYLQECIALRGEAIASYDYWKKAFRSFIKTVPDSISVALVLVPHCAQTSHKYLERMQQLGASLDSSVLDPNPRLYQQIKKDFPNVQLVDPLSSFQAYENQAKQLYFDNDPHLNPLGQQLLAKIIQDQIFNGN